ncbi:hypothetical protein [Draconibacterium orientale]|uniref:hypothetical protein n=1 Tax=Draconibacterium orientale TaxID=1168034 RepID=UPI002A0A6A4A|nr:hypothetical protein [Draconibacterium orientale]
MIFRNPSLRKLQDEYEEQLQKYNLLKGEWNMLIRNFYKKNMGVGLIEGSNRHYIQVIIKPAPKQNFIDIIENNFPYLDFEELNVLSQFVPAAKRAIPYFNNTGAEPHLANSIEMATKLLKGFEIKELTDSIFPFLKTNNKDIFGSYFLNDNHIEIYVFPIKLFCFLHGLDDNTFFVMVLAHELAHGYNHIGFDKDNRLWDSFRETDDYVAEGLAQYYTSKFIESYLHKDPKLKEVFESLLKFQPEPYNAFKDWDLSMEQMYGAFIDARRNNVTGYSEFAERMNNAKSRIA